MSNALDKKETPILELAKRWVSEDKDPRTRQQIEALVAGNETAKLEELLRQPIEFGTAGLRARMEAGYSRLNQLTVITASQGLAAYVERNVAGAQVRGIVIGHDHRHNSRTFALLTARAFLDRGFKVHFYPAIGPTPMVPFAVKRLHAACGVMVTASHNPKDDNGYKVYWENGAQIKPPLDEGIAQSIRENSTPVNWDTKGVESDPSVVDVTEAMTAAYFDAAKALVSDRQPNGTAAAAALRYVYTPMHGVGAPFAARVLEAFGLPPYIPVPEQIQPDPDFPTVSFPNPEEMGALDMAKAVADREDAGLVVANDPDADRFAAAERQADGSWLAFTGDQLGTIFAASVLEDCRRKGIEDSRIAMVNSTVSSRMLGEMARKEGFHYTDTLTGFKWMANELADLSSQKGGYHAAFGYEEAIGYMIGDQVLDKDGITALGCFVQLATRLNNQGLRVSDYLEAQYARYGYFVSANSYFISPDPLKTDKIFARIRYGDDNVDGGIRRTAFVRATSSGEEVLRYPLTIGGFPVCYICDLTIGFEMSNVDKMYCGSNKQHQPIAIAKGECVPKFPVSAASHMITFETCNGGRLTMRTSGTEPKLKYYLEVRDNAYDRSIVANDLDAMSRAVADELVQASRNGL
ncbi:hypothetical protein LPJ59_005668 [Coemansia sp. RSA 2399]|nr:hypothetical protein LPJ59_005668 [Coemansia sp. RSA 2399]